MKFYNFDVDETMRYLSGEKSNNFMCNPRLKSIKRIIKIIIIANFYLVLWYSILYSIVNIRCR